MISGLVGRALQLPRRLRRSRQHRYRAVNLRRALHAVRRRGHADRPGDRHRRDGIDQLLPRRPRGGQELLAGDPRADHAGRRRLQADRPARLHGLAARALRHLRHAPVASRDGRRAPTVRRESAVALLEARGIGKSFGALRALDGVDLSVQRQQLPRADRPQRLGQEHASQGAGRRASARPGPDHVRRRRHHDHEPGRPRARSVSASSSRSPPCCPSSRSTTTCCSRCRRTSRSGACCARAPSTRCTTRSWRRWSASGSQSAATTWRSS